METNAKVGNKKTIHKWLPQRIPIIDNGLRTYMQERYSPSHSNAGNLPPPEVHQQSPICLPGGAHSPYWIPKHECLTITKPNPSYSLPLPLCSQPAPQSSPQSG